MTGKEELGKWRLMRGRILAAKRELIAGGSLSACCLWPEERGTRFEILRQSVSNNSHYQSIRMIQRNAILHLYRFSADNHLIEVSPLVFFGANQRLRKEQSGGESAAEAKSYSP